MKPPSGRTRARRSLPPRSHWVPADAATHWALTGHALGADGPWATGRCRAFSDTAASHTAPQSVPGPPNALCEGSGPGARGRRLGLDAGVGESLGPLPPRPILLMVPRPRPPDQGPARPHARRPGAATSWVRSGKTEARNWSRGLSGSGQGTRSERTIGKRWKGERVSQTPSHQIYLQS